MMKHTHVWNNRYKNISIVIYIVIFIIWRNNVITFSIHKFSNLYFNLFTWWSLKIIKEDSKIYLHVQTVSQIVFLKNSSVFGIYHSSWKRFSIPTKHFFGYDICVKIFTKKKTVKILSIKFKKCTDTCNLVSNIHIAKFIFSIIPHLDLIQNCQ